MTPRQISIMVLCCILIVLIFMIICLTSSYWITTDKFRQGLIYLCVEPGFNNLKSPFGLENLEPGCYPNRDAGKHSLLLQIESPYIASIFDRKYSNNLHFSTKYRLHKAYNPFVPHNNVIYISGINYVGRRAMFTIQQQI